MTDDILNKLDEMYSDALLESRGSDSEKKAALEVCRVAIEYIKETVQCDTYDHQMDENGDDYCQHDSEDCQKCIKLKELAKILGVEVKE